MNKPTLISGSITPNPWAELRQFTDARIALGRAGVSLPTQASLAFQLAHAQARDAVHLALDIQALQAAMSHLDLDLDHESLLLHSAAADRLTYLQRPDLGRRLDAASRATLLARGANGERVFDVVFVVADGLSPLAIGRHAPPFLAGILPLVQAEGWTLAPLVLAQQGRVALGDEIGELLGARLVVVLIGERPGLSSPDSMGIYMTWMPRVGLTDADRNCISNVRLAGMSYSEATRKLHGLMKAAHSRQMSGVALKDETPSTAIR